LKQLELLHAEWYFNSTSNDIEILQLVTRSLGPSQVVLYIVSQQLSYSS